MAQGLASLGRGQDSMLVHMTPGEVHGLQSLAQQHGGSLTINPQTGLPEAGFLSNILPMVAAAAAIYFTGGAAAPAAEGLMAGEGAAGAGGFMGLGAAGTGALAGGLTGGLQAYMGGKNPIMGAIGGGLAGYGVGGIGNSLAAAAPEMGYSASALPSGAGSAAIPQLANESYTAFAPNLSTTVPLNVSGPAGLAEFAQPGFGVNTAGVTMPLEANLSPIEYASRNAKMGAGLGNVFDSPSNAFNFAKGNIGNIASVAAPMVMSSLGTQNTLPVGTGSTGPQNFANYAMKPMQYDPKTGKYSNPTYSPVNYSTSYNPNMAYAAGGGSMQDIQANSQPVMPPNQMIGGAAPNENQFYPGANIARGGASGAPQSPAATDVVGGYDQKLDQYTGEPVRMAGGGLASLDTYAAGGRLLQGPGDGMSDSIPAVIGGAKPQRAALAQGEFVVPADVVSHLGNGSTDAGSKRLYAMMDKVRHARTGNKKQGRQINPDQFMPA